MTVRISFLGKLLTAPFSYSYLGIAKVVTLIGIRGLFAVLLVGVFLIGSIMACVAEQSPMPFFEFVGSTITASDHKIGKELDYFLSIRTPDFVDVAIFLFNIFSSLYLTYIFFYLGFKIYDWKSNQSDPHLKKLAWVFGVLVGLNFLWQTFIWLVKISNGEQFQPTPTNFVKFFFPFTNIFRLALNGPYIYQFLKLHKNNLLINWFNPEVRYNEGIEPEKMEGVKNAIRFVGNLPQYVREGLAGMKRDLFTYKDWGAG